MEKTGSTLARIWKILHGTRQDNNLVKFGQNHSISVNFGQKFLIPKMPPTFVQQIAPEAPVINYFIHPIKELQQWQNQI